MKMQVPLLKNYSTFQDSKSRALNQAQGPSTYRALCNCIDHRPMKLALSTENVDFILYVIGLSINIYWISEWIRLTPLICQESVRVGTRQICFDVNIGEKENKYET